MFHEMFLKMIQFTKLVRARNFTNKFRKLKKVVHGTYFSKLILTFYTLLQIMLLIKFLIQFGKLTGSTSKIFLGSAIIQPLQFFEENYLKNMPIRESVKGEHL